MIENEKTDLASLVSDVMGHYGKTPSSFDLSIWWQAMRGFEFEQVSRALGRHVTNPDNGQWCPKVADVVRLLAGTTSDKANLAWGKVNDAMSDVGSYCDVVFDDPAIHAAIDDMGGWPKLCRAELKDLTYAQHRFCESYRAYMGKESFDYPRILGGERNPDDEYLRVGLKPPIPKVVGNVANARLVWSGGAIGGKTKISHTAFDSLQLGGNELARAA